jgi:hypothetical protein
MKDDFVAVRVGKAGNDVSSARGNASSTRALVNRGAETSVGAFR